MELILKRHKAKKITHWSIFMYKLFYYTLFGRKYVWQTPYRFRYHTTTDWEPLINSTALHLTNIFISTHSRVQFLSHCLESPLSGDSENTAINDSVICCWGNISPRNELINSLSQSAGPVPQLTLSPYLHSLLTFHELFFPANRLAHNLGILFFFI